MRAPIRQSALSFPKLLRAKMLHLTKRDILLLQVLGDYELLSTRQLRSLVFPGIRKTTALRRLRKLENEKLIRRIHGLKGGEFVWSLLMSGANRIHRDSCIERINRNSIEHDVLLNDIRIHLERMKIVTGWHTEQAIRRASSKSNSEIRNNLNPDAIASVRTPNGNEAVAIELELFAKNSSRYRKTFSQYGEIKSLWAIWYVVPTFSLGKRVTKEWLKAHSNEGCPQFYFLLISEVLHPDSPITLHGTNGNRMIHKTAHLHADAVSREPGGLCNKIAS